MRLRVIGRRFGVVLVASLLLMGGCSGKGQSGATPGGASSSTALPSPSRSSSQPTGPAPTATETAPVPTSPFEDRDQVVVARSWARAVADSINDGDARLKAARADSTTHGRRVLPGLFAKEVGRFYPGPVPFTPTAVTTDDDRATVDVCLLASGFSRVKGSKATDPRRVDPARMTFERVDGAWKIDELQSRGGSCSGVKVEALSDPSFKDGSVATTPAPSASVPTTSPTPTSKRTTASP